MALALHYQIPFQEYQARCFKFVFEIQLVSPFPLYNIVFWTGAIIQVESESLYSLNEIFHNLLQPVQIVRSCSVGGRLL